MSKDADLLEADEERLGNVGEDVPRVADGLRSALHLAGQIHLREDLLGEPVVSAGSAEGVEVWEDERSACGEGIRVGHAFAAAVSGYELKQPWIARSSGRD